MYAASVCSTRCDPCRLRVRDGGHDVVWNETHVLDAIDASILFRMNLRYQAGDSVARPLNSRFVGHLEDHPLIDGPVSVVAKSPMRESSATEADF